MVSMRRCTWRLCISRTTSEHFSPPVTTNRPSVVTASACTRSPVSTAATSLPVTVYVYSVSDLC